MKKATIREADVQGKRVLVRVDFNVPLDAELHITDDTRIRAALPTLEYLLGHHAAVILMSHLGRPDGQRIEKLSLQPIAEHLAKLLARPVALASDCIGAETAQMAQSLQPGEVLLLENLRFHKEEEKNTPKFARQLSALGQVYVNDAFGTAHRAHASTEGIAHLVPGYAGFLMEKELEYLGSALEQPRRPFVAIVGGAKISDKIGVLDRLLALADALLIGGAMANTFLKAQGYGVGLSLVEDDKLDEARRILAAAKAQNKPLLLPVDVVIAETLSANAQSQLVTLAQVREDWCILDIGPETVQLFQQELLRAHTVVFNGTLGVAEFPAFAKGTNAILEVLAEATAHGVTTIIGGGDSAAAAEAAGAATKVSHVSTGGGASLEFLEGRTLPGVAALQDAQASTPIMYA
jgi:phosphoglycerate kinase